MPKNLKQFLLQNKEYFWDCKISEISEAMILERLINYADIYEFKQFIALVGFDEARSLFLKLVSKKRINILTEKLLHYFYLFFGIENEVSYRDIVKRAKKSSFFHSAV